MRGILDVEDERPEPGPSSGLSDHLLPDGERTLTALVVARNEAARLSDCLKALAFADEIVVLLDRTADASSEIARAAGARIVEGAWPIEGDRRNAGLAACAGAWVLEVDADEIVPPDLAAEIRESIAGTSHAGFLIPFENRLCGRVVRHGWGGMVGVREVLRLSRRGTKTWGRARVHPPVTLNGSAGRLAHPIAHDMGGVSDLLRRLDRWSAWRAADLREQGATGSLPANIRRAAGRFLKCYIGRGGWREGPVGFLIATAAALYPLLSHLRARIETDEH